MLIFTYPNKDRRPTPRLRNLKLRVSALGKRYCPSQISPDRACISELEKSTHFIYGGCMLSGINSWTSGKRDFGTQVRLLPSATIKRFRRLTPLMSKRQRLPSNRLGISHGGGCHSLSKTLTFLFLYGGSLIGKAADSKSVRCRFDSDPSCHRILKQAPLLP